MQAFTAPFKCAADQICGTSGRSAAGHSVAKLGQVRGRVLRATGSTPSSGGGKRKDKQQQELQDLLIDPAYDPLFDVSDEESSSAAQDPFAAPSKPSKTKPKKRSGRPVGTARTKTTFEEEASEDYFRRRQIERQHESGQEAVEDEFNLLFPTGEEEQPVMSAFDLQLMYMRHYYLQEQQEEVMELHHKHRATEVSQYAQATALAHLMERFEREDELSEDHDPLPSWIRAKRMIADNWELMEHLAGSREDKIRNVREFQGMTEERQHLIDTWDESLYVGERDPDELPVDYVDQFLRLSAPKEERPIQGEPSSDDLMSDILPDIPDSLADNA